jgi:hypothetical protein
MKRDGRFKHTSAARISGDDAIFLGGKARAHKRNRNHLLNRDVGAAHGFGHSSGVSGGEGTRGVEAGNEDGAIASL